MNVTVYLTVKLQDNLTVILRPFITVYAAFQSVTQKTQARKVINF